MSNLYMGGSLSAGGDPLDLLKSMNETHVPNTHVEPLSTEQEVTLMARIEDAFRLEEQPEKEDVEMADDDDEEEEVDLEDQTRRTERLRAVLPTLAHLWYSGSQQIDVATEILADGSRDYKWRIPLGESGILDFYLEIFSTHDFRQALKIHTLRLIGNSCADTDENRARVVAYPATMPAIMIHLSDMSLLPFAIPVLFNICIDYEPAQKQASSSYLTRELINVISWPMLSDAKAFLGYICKLLGFMGAQSTNLELAPDNTAIVLLRIAADRESPVDMDDFISLVNVACLYLQHERFQIALIVQGAVDITLAVLVDSYTRFDSHPSIGTTSTEQNDAKALTQMRSALNQVLSDVSALPEFKSAYPVISPLTSSLRRWLLSPQLQLQVCACIMLGNLARSDQACIDFVQISQVHKPLISIISEATDSQLLHAALGFLKNLTLPLSNKELMGSNAGLCDVLPRLWLLDTLPQIQFAAISLARQLTIGTFENVRRIVQKLSEDEDSPASNHTSLSIVIALYNRTDQEPIKMEIARLITSCCRVFTSYTGYPEERMNSIRSRFFKVHPDVGRPLSFMVSQNKWPVVKSEGWFVFALMARYPEGAQCISDILHDVAVFRPLVELLTGKNPITDSIPSPGGTNSLSPPASSSTPSTSHTTPIAEDLGLAPEPVQPHAQAAEMARLDRENALVLVSEMLKNRGKDMAVMRRALFEDLLKGGSEIVMSYKEAKPAWDRETTVPVDRSKRATAGLNLGQTVEQSVYELS